MATKISIATGRAAMSGRVSRSSAWPKTTPPISTCLLAALIISAAVSGNVQQDLVAYWWVAAPVVGLIGVAAHHLLTDDR